MIISIANQKGGVAKTTTAFNIGASLTLEGKQVLLVDLDPQGSLTIAAGCRGRAKYTIYDVLMKNTPICYAVEEIMLDKDHALDIITANIDLAAAELELIDMLERETTLKRALNPVSDKMEDFNILAKYDYILIDCPPTLGMLTINALSAADKVIIPVSAEFLALQGVGLLVQTIRNVKNRFNPDLTIEGILVTLHDSRAVHHREAVEELRASFPNQVFDTVINRSIKFAEAAISGQPVILYAPSIQGAAAYRQIARRMIDCG